MITELTVRLLYGIPAAMSSARCCFPSVKTAVNAVIETIQSGVPRARIELVNATMVDAINRYAKLELPVAPTLWLDFHGTEAGVAEQAQWVQRIAGDHGGASFAWTANPEDRLVLWKALPRCGLCHEGAAAGRAALSHGRLRASFGPGRMHHRDGEGPRGLLFAGTNRRPCCDGNFHLGIVLDPNDPREVAEAERLNDRLVRRALALDGTCSGEHGVDYGKIDFLVAEHGEAITVMRAIKQAIDPDNLMNPGKILRV